VELMRDHGPVRRFGNVGMELFDLRHFDRDEVLQQVLNKGTTRYQLTYNDRPLQFFRTFVEATEKANYFELPPADSWDFVREETRLSAQPEVVAKGADCSFAFQPIVDPFMQQVVSWEALLRTPPATRREPISPICRVTKCTPLICKASRWRSPWPARWGYRTRRYPSTCCL
jgi:hypothetical protein